MNDFAYDLDLILRSMNVSESYLADLLGFKTPSVSAWLKGKYEADERSREDIYRFAYDNGLRINEAHEEPYRKLCEKDRLTLLFHGSRNGISSDIDLSYSKENNDFGKGFYCGESFAQASMFVSEYRKSGVYAYGLNTKGLNKKEFSVDLDWVLTIAYYRGFLDEYRDRKIIKRLIADIKRKDLIIAPIADNRMFDMIAEFTEGAITDEACKAGLAALDLGRQYVLRSEKALKQLGYLKRFYLCEEERREYHQLSNQRYQQRMEGIRDFRSRYRNGKYIEEIMNDGD